MNKIKVTLYVFTIFYYYYKEQGCYTIIQTIYTLFKQLTAKFLIFKFLGAAWFWHKFLAYGPNFSLYGEI